MRKKSDLCKNCCKKFLDVTVALLNVIVQSVLLPLVTGIAGGFEAIPVLVIIVIIVFTVGSVSVVYFYFFPDITLEGLSLVWVPISEVANIIILFWNTFWTSGYSPIARLVNNTFSFLFLQVENFIISVCGQPFPPSTVSQCTPLEVALQQFLDWLLFFGDVLTLIVIPTMTAIFNNLVAQMCSIDVGLNPGSNITCTMPMGFQQQRDHNQRFFYHFGGKQFEHTHQTFYVMQKYNQLGSILEDYIASQHRKKYGGEWFRPQEREGGGGGGSAGATRNSWQDYDSSLSKHMYPTTDGSRLGTMMVVRLVYTQLQNNIFVVLKFLIADVFYFLITTFLSVVILLMSFFLDLFLMAFRLAAALVVVALDTVYELFVAFLYFIGYQFPPNADQDQILAVVQDILSAGSTFLFTEISPGPSELKYDVLLPVLDFLQSVVSFVVSHIVVELHDFAQLIDAMSCYFNPITNLLPCIELNFCNVLFSSTSVLHDVLVPFFGVINFLLNNLHANLAILGININWPSDLSSFLLAQCFANVQITNNGLGCPCAQCEISSTNLLRYLGFSFVPNDMDSGCFSTLCTPNSLYLRLVDPQYVLENLDFCTVVQNSCIQGMCRAVLPGGPQQCSIYDLCPYIFSGNYKGYCYGINNIPSPSSSTPCTIQNVVNVANVANSCAFYFVAPTIVNITDVCTSPGSNFPTDPLGLTITYLKNVTNTMIRQAMLPILFNQTFLVNQTVFVNVTYQVNVTTNSTTNATELVTLWAFENVTQLVNVTTSTNMSIPQTFVPTDNNGNYVPPTLGTYGFMTLRDYAIMLEGNADAFTADEIWQLLRFITSFQRSDGAMPDSIDSNGVPSYIQDGRGVVPALDIGPYFVDIVYQSWVATGNSSIIVYALGAMNGVMNFTSSNYLSNCMLQFTLNPPLQVTTLRQVGWGFHKDVVKHGYGFVETVLFQQARLQLTEMCTFIGDLACINIYGDSVAQTCTSNNLNSVNTFWNSAISPMATATYLPPPIQVSQEQEYMGDLWGTLMASRLGYLTNTNLNTFQPWIKFQVESIDDLFISSSNLWPEGSIPTATIFYSGAPQAPFGNNGISPRNLFEFTNTGPPLQNSLAPGQWEQGQSYWPMFSGLVALSLYKANNADNLQSVLYTTFVTSGWSLPEWISTTPSVTGGEQCILSAVYPMESLKWFWFYSKQGQTIPSVAKFVRW